MTTPAHILAAVHHATGCEPEAITSKCRKHSVLFPRYIALLLLRESRPFHSEIELGQLIGIETHGTARYALGKAREMLASEPNFQQAHAKAREALRQTTQ